MTDNSSLEDADWTVSLDDVAVVTDDQTDETENTMSATSITPSEMSATSITPSEMSATSITPSEMSATSITPDNEETAENFGAVSDD